MKKLILAALMLAAAGTLAAKDKIIDSPGYEVQNSGIDHVTRIELGKKETRLYVTTTFMPNWWNSFDKTTFIQESGTKNRLYIKDMIGGEIGEWIFTPASGDTSVVLIFPPLDKSVKKIDFGMELEQKDVDSSSNVEKIDVFGISLDPKESGKTPRHIVPEEIKAWLEAEVARSDRQVPTAPDAPDFLRNGKARLVGYIKGYDPRIGFSSGILYAKNEITHEDFPCVIELLPDGRFTADVPMNHPGEVFGYLANRSTTFYLEPGATTAVILDWNDFLLADRYRDREGEFKNTVFLGPLAQINDDLKQYPVRYRKWVNTHEAVKTIAPADFKKQQDSLLTQELAALKAETEQHAFTPQALSIKKNCALMRHATYLLEYPSSREYISSDEANDITRTPLPEDYYDFLQLIPMNDQALMLSTDFSMFINRLEYCKPLQPGYAQSTVLTPAKTFTQYLEEEEKITVPEDEKALLRQVREIFENEELSMEQKMESYKEVEPLVIAFNEKYKLETENYAKIYVEPLFAANRSSSFQKQWEAKDSLLANKLHLSADALAWQIVKARALGFQFQQLDKAGAREYLTEFKAGISNPFLAREAEQMFEMTYAEAPYVLPEGKGADIFRSIADRFRGKIVFVDFWATTCGPCVAGIQQMKETRARYKGNDYFVFIFITDDRSSPKERYDEFVAEQELEHTFRITEGDHNYLRELFRFNGIPHYIVIGRNGEVLENNFRMYNFEYELPKILEKDSESN